MWKSSFSQTSERMAICLWTPDEVTKAAYVSHFRHEQQTRHKVQHTNCRHFSHKESICCGTQKITNTMSQSPRHTLHPQECSKMQATDRGTTWQTCCRVLAQHKLTVSMHICIGWTQHQIGTRYKPRITNLRKNHRLHQLSSKENHQDQITD